MTPRTGGANAGEKALTVLVTGSEEETFYVAAELAKGFAGREVILLSGELGAGKTVFAKGLAFGLGVEDPGQVYSPYHTLDNVYKERIPVFHIDL